MPGPAAPPSPVTVRAAGPGDRNFVLKTWLLTLRNASHESWHVVNEDFFAGEQVILKRVLARPSCRTLIAHPPDDPELIAGFLVFEPPVLVHFVYTKAALRRAGVARALLEAAGLDPAAGLVASSATHDLTKGWIRSKYPLVRFNRYRRILECISE